MNIAQLEIFNNLLAAWRDHQDNRESNASIAELAHSRERLDAARMQSHLLR